MRWTVTLVVALLVGCGGRASSSSTHESNGGAAAITPGVGAIDSAGLPQELPNECTGGLSELHLKLPCQMGMSLAGSYDSANVVECYDSNGRTALSFTVPFGELPALIDRPVALPFDELPSQPNVGLAIGGMIYTGLLTGTAVFSQVDPVARSFVARLSDASITWTRWDGVTSTCSVPETELWAIAGNFR